MAVYLGLDCGGSSCRALTVDDAGQVLHTGQSGPANILSTPRAKLREHLRRATAGCPPVNVACGCFAGLLTRADRRLAIELLSDLFPEARVRCEPDYVAALMACDDGTHVCTVAGTGSVVCSRDGDAVRKSGGRGYLLGNPGSAFHFGRDAIRAFLELGPGGVGESLRNAVERQFDSLEENEVVAGVHRSSSPAAVLARFATPWGKDAAEGNGPALESVRAGSELLAIQTAAHVLRYSPTADPVRVTLAGGLWNGPAIYRETFRDAVAARLSPRVTHVERISQPPVRGAVRLAAETRR